MINSRIPNPKRVLVADDRKEIAHTLNMILPQHGLERAVAVEAAIEKAIPSPQTLLCNIMMPEIDGLETL